MNPKIKIIKCPQCGSTRVKRYEDEHYECLNCQTAFYIETQQTTINHKHTYNKPPVAPGNKKLMPLLVLGIIAFLSILILPQLFSKKNHMASEEKTVTKAFSFNDPVAVSFVDTGKNMKLFMIGKIRANNSDNDRYKNKVYWAVYDVAKGTMDQLNPLLINNQEVITDGFPRFEHFKFDDGNIYTIYNGLHILKYDVMNKTVNYLNNEIVAGVKELQSGIAEVDDATHKTSAFEIKSNSGKEIFYYPISKLVVLDNFNFTSQKQTYPGNSVTTFFMTTRNQPRYLVKYRADYSKGYPFVFDPYIESTFDDNENFVRADFGSYWAAASHLIDYEVLNTDRKVYKTALIDYRDNVIAVGMKSSMQDDEVYTLQMQDYNGNILWSAKTDDTYMQEFKGSVTKEWGVVYEGCCRGFKYYDAKGSYVKEIKTDEISFEIK